MMALLPLRSWLLSAFVTLCWSSSASPIILNIPDTVIQNVTGTASWTQESPLQTAMVVNFTFSAHQRILKGGHNNTSGKDHAAPGPDEDVTTIQEGFTATLSEPVGTFTYYFRQTGLYSVTASVLTPLQAQGSTPFTAVNGSFVHVRSPPTAELQRTNTSVTGHDGTSSTSPFPSSSSSSMPTPVSTRTSIDESNQPRRHLRLILGIVIPISSIAALLVAGLIFHRRRRMRQNLQRKKYRILQFPFNSSDHSHSSRGTRLAHQTLARTAGNKQQSQIPQTNDRAAEEHSRRSIAALPVSLTGRQQELSAQVETIRIHLIAFEESLSDPSLSEDQSRHCLEEIEHLRVVMEGILGLRESDWARGVIDDPPPAYEDLRSWEYGRVIS